MKNPDGADNRRSLLTALIVSGVIAVFAFMPYLSGSSAANKQKSNQVQNTDEKFEYYDIRNDKNAAETLLSFRQTANRDAVENADVRDKFAAAERRLRQTVPTLKIEYNKELQNPEIIAPDIMQGRAVLTSPSNANRANVLRGFAKSNNDLIALSDTQLDKLKVAADYTNPNGELSFARLEQTANGIPIFHAEIRAGFNKNGEMFRVINNLAPGIDENALSTDFGEAGEAVTRAAGYINYTFKSGETIRNESASTDLKAVFGQGDWATTAEKIYFPTEIGVARPAWRVLIWEPVNAYYVIVDAATGTMLYRENITADQSQAATYNVYANTTNILRTMPNPAPLDSNPLSPAFGTQGVLQPRSNVTFIGNEAPYTFNNLGWITDNANGTNGLTDGNNTEAGVDRDTTNGIDTTVQGASRVFNFNYTPGAGANNSGGDSPLLPAYQNGAATNLFYVTNRYHDETYLLGFTEQARNFQNDNFGRGGLGSDRISAEAQDNTVGSACPTAPCYNNANFSTPADGSRGRMQMYLWSAMSPNRDGDLDAEIIVHELTHGVFGRLHNGVGGTQAGQMNEGNSDFFAHVLLANPTDPINSISVLGAYTTLNLRSTSPFSSVGNYYYGIRRFPKAVLAFTGGPNNRPHNPLTYADIDPAQMSLTNGAFAPAFPGSATAVHDGGEIWSSMLWEIRARLVQRLGFQAGSRKVLQLVMDGMKVSPSNPTMMQERNAILAAAIANGNINDVGDIWAGFALRGLGANAENPTGNTVVENFELPNASLADTGFAVSDPAPGDNDGFPEPGETVRLTVPVINATGNTLIDVVVLVNGGSTGYYGNIANGETVVRNISYTIPSNAACGSKQTVTFTIASNNVSTTTTQTRSFSLGKPVFAGTTQNFDGVTAPALPLGWTQENSGSNTGWITSTAAPNSAPNTAFAPSPALPGEASLYASANINSATAQLNFKTFYNTESTWDGMVLEMQIGSGAYQDITAVGGSFVSGGYNTTMNISSPLGARQAWTGNSSVFVNTVVNLPSSVNGQKINLRWRTVSDDNTTASGTPGLKIDDVVLTGGVLLNSYECANTPTAAKTKFDFDGDGKADVSVFRPSDGFWYLLNSNTGFTGAKFGQNGDRIAPADFDGDGKTDLTVFRSGTWYIQRSTAGFFGINFGEAGDILQPADFDSDGKAEIAVYRPSNGTWYVYNLATGSFNGYQWGQNGDKPVVGDYDNDGRADYAVFRPSNATWYIQRSTFGFASFNFGEANDKPVPADYDGDGRTDVAVFRPSSGIWYINRSTDGFTAMAFGQNGDVPAAADFDGDGKADTAVFRGGTWYMQRSTAGFMGVSFGVSSDLPAPASFVQ